MKKSYLKALSTLSASLFIASCGFDFPNGSISNDGSDVGSETSSIDNDTDVSIDSGVSSGDYVPSETDIAISLANNSSSASDSSKVEISENIITINSLGTYVVTGSLSDGQLLIKATKTSSIEDVIVVLNGASIACDSGAPIFSSGSAKPKLFKADGSVNYVHDARSSSTSSAYTGDDNAAIFSDKKLKVFGSGKLSVEADFNNGVGSDDGVELKNGELSIVSYNHCIKSHEKIELGGVVGEDEGGSFSLKSLTGSCLRSDSETNIDEDTSTYFLTSITQGTYVMVSEFDAIEIDGLLNISGGHIDITTGGLDKTAHGSSSSYTLTTDMDSRKGIKCDHDISISGTATDISLDCFDDGVHSNGSISISGGTFSVAVATASKKSTSTGGPGGGSSTKGSDAIHADGNVVVSGGTINVVKSYEAIEGTTITFSGGTTYCIASDDGVNAANGDEESGSQYQINIAGGYLYIDSGGDGLDSNGSIAMSGGVVVVAGPSSNGDAPVDTGDQYKMSISGGLLVAYGSSGMATGPTTGSQYSILAKHSSVVSSSSYYLLTNSSGVILYAIKPYAKSSISGGSSSYSYSFVFSAPNLSSGTYYLKSSSSYTDGEEVFKQVYINGSVSSSSQIASWSWSSSNVHATYGSGGR